MIKHSADYAAAVVGDVRRTFLRAEMLFISPTLEYGTPEGGFAEGYAKPSQISDQKFTGGDKYSTLELNRTLLDGSMKIMPDDPADIIGQVGAVSDTISGADGVFSPAWSLTLPILGVPTLQSCTIWFAGGEINGLPVDFTVDILDESGNVGHTETFTEHRSMEAEFTGFTVYNPSGIRLNIQKWSMPHYRARVTEMLPGLYELWDNHIFSAFSVNQQANFTNLALPYGTCTIQIDNSDKRFEPMTKDSLFESIEARQSINTSIGVQLDNGEIEYIPTGRYYQADGGWTTGNNSLSMQWDLMDIVGLVVDRAFVIPETLPTTLEGWIRAAMSVLGEGFTNQYIIADGYAGMAVTANTADDLAGLTSGDIIRYACMAAGCYSHADNETGKLIVEPVGDTGDTLTLGNLTAYANIKANPNMGMLTFMLADGAGTKVVVEGDNIASSNSQTVASPFMHTEAQAKAAAAMILKSYGGNIFETVGRGNPASEVGDIDTIQLSPITTARGRRMTQTLSYQNGVLSGCTASFLQIKDE